MALSLEEQTRKALMTLPPLEEQIVRLRFGIGQKVDCTVDSWQSFGLTRERIRQISQGAAQAAHSSARRSRQTRVPRTSGATAR
jgi:RNA polymerase primary sigma factor